MTWTIFRDKATASLASPRCAGDVPPPVRDFSLKCYDARGARIGEAVKLDDRFDQAPRDATVAGPVQLCNAVEITRRGGAVVENPDPSVSFTCYELAQGATKLPGVRESNLFGRDQALQVGRPRTLCVPNDKPAG
jgi:hypothetical protein